jgi:hypothetical protein
MIFKPGDILESGNPDRTGMTCRTVLSVDIKKKIYELGFIDDPTNLPYTWTFSMADVTYRLAVPKYIPEEQHEKYRKMKNNG